MLQPDQTILGAVQIGTCSDINDANPYEKKDSERYMGWEEGHNRAVEIHRLQEKWAALPLYRKILCKLSFHKYRVKLIPGRPHIGSGGNIDRRDPIIKRYICIYCEE